MTTMEMEELINNQTKQISGLQERVLFKDLIEQIFLSLYETNREMYRELENRVMDDLAPEGNRYLICMTVMRRDDVDLSHHLLGPMLPKDIKSGIPDREMISDQLATGSLCPVKSLFMKCDYLSIQKLLSRGEVDGTIRTDKGEYETRLVIRRNENYLQEISHLYQVFVRNGIPWKTINTAYLHKFVEVCLKELPEGLAVKEQILDIVPKLDDYDQWARENYIPLWNIRKLVLSSVGFPVPCEDFRSFEHTISIKNYGDEHVYLVDEEEGLSHIRQSESHLLVMGKEGAARKWKIYMIRSGVNRRFERLAHPMLTNMRKDSFLERFSKKQGIEVRTHAELARYLQGYSLDDYLTFVDCEITDRPSGEAESYSMNSFILDEIRDSTYQKCLRLKFRGKSKENYLLRDMMSFLVSEAQLIYREYQCQGELLL